MPAANDHFDRAFDYVLRNEGGFSDHSSDSGGATKYGITIATLSRWRQSACSVGDVQTLSRDEAKAIYRDWYWDRLQLDKVSSLVIATVLFDAAVLFGVRVAAVRAQKVLRRIAPLLTVDGVIGPKTVEVLNRADDVTFVTGFRAELRQRIDEVIRIAPKNAVFRDGWNNRVDRFTTLVA